MTKVKNSRIGRPPVFKDVAEMQAKIDEYFKACEGEILKDNYGDTIFDKYGQPVIVNTRPPTITGLALALGFTSRQALLNYQAKREFFDTNTRAKSRVEAYTESRLFDKDGANGAKFSLANNFTGWSDKQEVKQELTGKAGGAIETKSQVILYLPDNGRETQ